MNKIIFLNTGWMHEYKGLGGDKISGGGKHVDKTGWGGEMFNFLPQNNKYFGYAETWGAINLNRIDPDLETDFIDNITIIWTARRPKVGGTYIVGWYKNARLFRTFQPGTKKGNRTFKGKQMDFIAVAEKKDCKLLPPDKRLLKIPRGLNGMGQRNVWYADKSPRFVKTVRNFIQNGRLPKRIKKPAGRGYPIQIDPLKRQLVETNAVKQIIKYYKTEGYSVRSVERDNLGWDLYATYNDIELKLEVKGLSGSAIIAELTPNEYEQLKKHKDSYRLCIVAKALTAKPDVRIFSYSTELREWIDDNENILDVNPIISARVSI